MTRLCGLNPNIDYTPIQWALRTVFRDPDVPPQVLGTVEAETTVTAYEALSDAERAILLLLNAECHYRFPDQVWTIRIDLHGNRFQFAYQADRGYTLKEFIGYILDHGYCPALVGEDHIMPPQTYMFRWRDQ